MPKKKKKATSVKKKLTCIQFLRDLYTDDTLVANDKALRLLKKKFPNSKADVRAIVTWKNILRAEGIDIPKRKVEQTKKKGKKTKKKKSRK